jgi:hypothetical protein
MMIEPGSPPKPQIVLQLKSQRNWGWLHLGVYNSKLPKSRIYKMRQKQDVLHLPLFH